MLKDKIGYRFQNPVLFRKALTHSSYANEQRARHLQHNERLEFLGDSVLGFVTADYLYNHFPELPEGELTKLRAAVVCEQALYEVAKELGIDKEICLGHGEETSGGRRRPSILADAVEALLGAIYLDGGIEPARAFVLSFIPQAAERARQGRMFKDYKTALQEIVQKNRQETLESDWLARAVRTMIRPLPCSCCSIPTSLQKERDTAKRKLSRWQPNRHWS